MRTMGTAMAKITKTAAEKRYPHSTGEMAEIMLKGGNDLDQESLFGECFAVCWRSKIKKERREIS